MEIQTFPCKKTASINLVNAVRVVQNNLAAIDASRLSELDQLGLKAARECFADIVALMNRPEYTIYWECGSANPEEKLDVLAGHGPFHNFEEARARLLEFRARGIKSSLVQGRFYR